MNQADLNAARRLIDQFNDRYDGRHNSSIEYRNNPVRFYISGLPPGPFKIHNNWKNCKVGEYCFCSHFNEIGERVVSTPEPAWLDRVPDFNSEYQPLSIPIWSFEHHRDTQGESIWRRVI